ncbi:MAG: UDP-N-acetylmuramoyl-L-alanyl-D-glutamate--2,6-diaminopimelate ligase [Verrucomicrobiia bacterium]|jgi:UDP-N-acetylmuramoyl-L-alanyl-D-glutamate--2,6-diaminopimelate ligase
MELRELIKVLNPRSVSGSLDCKVNGIAFNSRYVLPGYIFVALKGQNTDGHNFIADAIERGALAVVCERNGLNSARAVKIVVDDSRDALAKLSAAFYKNPSSRLKVIGVTGTNGKTTVSFMIKSIFEMAGIRSGLIGTIRYEIGERVIPAWRTTPESLDLQSMLYQMTREGCKACVMEVSSHALDQKRVLGIEFDAAVFTNLTQDHLDYHKNMDNYYEAKKKLFNAIQSPSKKSIAVINIDDCYGERLYRETDLAVRCSYGVKNQATIRASNINTSTNGSDFTVDLEGNKFDCHLPLIGRHNIYNALAAIGVALAFDIPINTIKYALSKMQPVPGRLEKIDVGQPFNVIVDYAHTDDALQNVLTSLRELTPGRLLLTFGCGGSRDTSKRYKMGAVAAKFADYTIITTDNPRKESPQKIASQIVEGYVAQRTDGFEVELDRKRAINAIVSMAKAGDTVLIAGKGHEAYQEFEDTIIPFDDRVYAREALESLNYKLNSTAGVRV